MPQGLRRVGTASAAVSAGALVLVLAAPAQPAAAEEVCKKGVDPETTIENWKCNLGNLREALTPKTPTPTPEPTKTTRKPAKKAAPSKKKAAPSRTAKAPAAKPRKRSPAPRVQAPTGDAPAPMSAPGRARANPGTTPPAPGLPGVLPTPEIAADPNAYQNLQASTVAMPQTRLVSPAATTRDDNGRMLLIAAAAGVAGAVGALNLSVAGRTLRRRRT
ncbi:hypothetical protein ACN3XK_33235 [Actinomadura welshii]